MSYVIAVITEFEQGAKIVTLKARGRAISRAVFPHDVGTPDPRLVFQTAQQGHGHASMPAEIREIPPPAAKQPGPETVRLCRMFRLREPVAELGT